MPESVIVDYKQAMFDAKDVESLRAEFVKAWAAANAISDTAALRRLKEYYDARKGRIGGGGMSEPLYKIAADYAEAAARLAETDLDEQTIADTLEGLAGDLRDKAIAVAQ